MFTSKKTSKAFTKNKITEKNWQDWQWQLTHSIKTAEQLAEYINVPPSQLKAIHKIITTRYSNRVDAMRLTPYLLSLIDFKDHQDPIALQHLPNAAEQESDNFGFKTIWEKDEDFLDGKNRMLQQKYPDIVVLRISNTCQAFCRFCFEKERTLRSGVGTIIGQKQFEEALKIIRKQKRLRQVLLSGGDPSILSDQFLKEKLEALIKIPQLKTIRINTRTLLHNPYRITPEFAKILGDLQKESWEPWRNYKFSGSTTNIKEIPKGKQIKIGVHFNHPAELTPEAIVAIRRLQAEGIELYNQTVLLKGVNDNVKTLQKLFRLLREEGVQLHYLSHGMAVPRTNHLRTTVRAGQEILRALRRTKEFRGQLPHYEMSHHTGKQIVLGMDDSFYESETLVAGKRQKVVKFLGDISSKWEIHPDGN